MNVKLNPDTIHAPAGNYVHAVKTPANVEWLTISGQVGVGKNGKLASGALKQTERAYRNILACLKANGMGKEDLIKTVVYLTDSRHIEAFRAARDKVLGTESPPASTLLIIDGLAHPDMLVEIEATAAKAAN